MIENNISRIRRFSFNSQNTSFYNSSSGDEDYRKAAKDVAGEGKSSLREETLAKKKPVFIEADFEASDSLAAELADLTGARPEDVRLVRVSRDLGGDLGRRKDAADAWLGALAQLDLDGANRMSVDRLLQPGHAEPAVDITTPEVPRADLQDDLATVEVMRRQTSFAGVLQTARNLCTSVERLHGSATE